MTLEPTWIIPLDAGETPEGIVRKAAQVAPHPRQLAWQAQELTAFVHFGVNTFTGREWGTGTEDPALFNPTDLDVRQWARVLAETGFRCVVLTAKHHDGFCLWQSRYTDFSVKSSSWKGGLGDVVRELADAAREFGLKLGVYLSPADLHEMENGNRYGNGSAAVESLIPTPVEGDTRKPGRTFRFTVDDYNRYYLNQLYELLTEYGPVDEVWFDGANPNPEVQETYNYPDWFALVRALAPDAVMFNGPDIRWVGNETGLARETEWSVLPFRGDPSAGLRPLDPLAANLGSRARLAEGGDYLAWYPAEVDVSIRQGWFYHAEEDGQVKTVDQLMEIYDYSVGRNGLLLLNIPPDRRGRFADVDVERLRAFAAEVERVYGHDLSRGARGDAAVDGSADTCWSPEDGGTVGEFVLELPEAITFNRVAIEEYLPLGQRVEAFAVDVWDGTAWRAAAEGTTVGYRRILRLDNTMAERVRVRITAARGCPSVRKVGLYRA